MSPLASRAPRRGGRLARLIAVPRQRRALLAEAVFELALAAVTIRLLPFSRTLAFAARPLRKDRLAAPALLAEIVTRAARLVPFRAVCFQQGFALQRMARRRGIDARLHYGVGTDPPYKRELGDKGLHAHVWITVGGVGVLGHEQAVHFRELLCSPA